MTPTTDTTDSTDRTPISAGGEGLHLSPKRCMATVPVFWFSRHTDLRRVSPAVASESDVLVVRDGKDGDTVCMALVDDRGDDTPAMLHRIGVHPEYRRQGIGAEVIGHLYDRYGSLELECPEGLSANEFYEAIGMEHVETEWGDPDDLLVWRLDHPPEHSGGDEGESNV